MNRMDWESMAAVDGIFTFQGLSLLKGRQLFCACELLTRKRDRHNTKKGFRSFIKLTLKEIT